jgi:putative FmdB family regulatory protein
MPIYEYVCKGCGHEFEREQRISEDPVKKCPSCGALKARRQISRTSFVLKGGGWYSDLYGAPKAGKSEDAASKDAKPAAAAQTAAESKTDAGAKSDATPNGGGKPPTGDGKPPKGDGMPPKTGGKGGKGSKAAA